jgi:hypothetical protein
LTGNIEFDKQTAHRFFSADCFNRAWELIDKPDRSEADDRAMLLLSLASLWHWTQREDVTATNLSVGYWQVARVNVLLKDAVSARKYGALSLAQSQKEGVEPFYLGYSFEALARAEALAGEREKADAYLQFARQACDQVTDPEEKKFLQDDLAGI